MLLFLDIDGVMVPAKSWKSPDILDDGFPVFSSKACKALNKILSKEDVVILTTSHKSNYAIEEWKSIFKKRGVSIDNIVLLNANLNNLSRKDELLNWFSVNIPQQEFIIIDDDKCLNDLPKSLKQRLILTNPLIGLTEEHLLEISKFYK